MRPTASDFEYLGNAIGRALNQITDNHELDMALRSHVAKAGRLVLQIWPQIVQHMCEVTQRLLAQRKSVEKKTSGKSLPDDDALVERNRKALDAHVKTIHSISDPTKREAALVAFQRTAIQLSLLQARSPLLDRNAWQFNIPVQDFDEHGDPMASGVEKIRPMKVERKSQMRDLLHRQGENDAAVCFELSRLVRSWDEGHVKSRVAAMTQKQLADLIGCSELTIKNWATAANVPPRAAQGQDYSETEVRRILEMGAGKRSKAGRDAAKMLRENR